MLDIAKTCYQFWNDNEILTNNLAAPFYCYSKKIKEIVSEEMKHK